VASSIGILLLSNRFFTSDYIKPVFRISLCDLRYFGVPLEVLYNLLTSRGDSDA
jgi:hypothetical protein